jgi:aminopeptidase N
MNMIKLKALLLLAVVVSSLNAAAQSKTFTHADSVRGMITPQRAWWDVTFYDLNVEVFPAEKKITGSVSMIYKVVSAGKVMQVDLQPPLKIERVIYKGSEVPFQNDGPNAYHVTLPSEQGIGTTDSVRVYYSGNPKIAKTPPWDGGFQFVKDKAGKDFIATSCQELGASVWWPCKDHQSEEPDSMRIAVTVPDSLMDVSNGRLRSIKTNSNQTKTYEWFVTNPINNYGVNVNVANYQHFADTLHGENGVLTLDFYVLPENLEKAKEHFKQAKLMLKAFEYWFGPYPFYEDGYKLVEVPYLGMEHQSSVTYGNRYQNGYLGHDLSGSGWGDKFDFIIIHESGHEWFANNITYKDIADMWVHEGFTNYSEGLFTEYYYGKEAATDYVTGSRRNIRNDTTIIGIYNVNHPGSGDMYPKSGNMLHTIRHSMNNDDLFRQILRGLNKTFYHQTVTTQQIENYISQSSGIDLSKVFDQYLRTTKIPELQYYIKKGNLYYRWFNVIDGFDLQLPMKTGTNPSILKPTTTWQKIPVKNKQPIVDKTYLERMFYIQVNSVKPL